MRSFWQGKTHPSIMLASWTFGTVLKGFRCFNNENLRSVGQRAAKLPAIKVWELFDPGRSQTRAEWFEWGRGLPADFFLRPSTLKAGNFEALYSLDPIFTVLKFLNPLKRYFKNQEASYNFKLGFVLSNRPYFNSAYLVRVPFLTNIAVGLVKSLTYSGAQLRINKALCRKFPLFKTSRRMLRLLPQLCPLKSSL